MPLPANHPGSCLLYFCFKFEFCKHPASGLLPNLTGPGIIRQKHMMGGEAFDTPMQVFVLSH
jgi:hypothetical protein